MSRMRGLDRIEAFILYKRKGSKKRGRSCRGKNGESLMRGGGREGESSARDSGIRNTEPQIRTRVAPTKTMGRKKRRREEKDEGEREEKER